MITTRAVPALLPAHHRRVATAPVSTRQDFADPLGGRVVILRGGEAGVPRPVFFVVAEDGLRLEALTRDLQRRYDVVGAASAATALTMLKDLANTGAEVALLIADERLTEIPAADLLARA